MNATTVLKIGISEYIGYVPECAKNLTRLSATPTCPDIGVSCYLLGTALSIAGIPYELVPIGANYDVANKSTGQWTGKMIAQTRTQANMKRHSFTDVCITIEFRATWLTAKRNGRRVR